MSFRVLSTTDPINLVIAFVFDRTTQEAYLSFSMEVNEGGCCPIPIPIPRIPLSEMFERGLGVLRDFFSDPIVQALAVTISERKTVLGWWGQGQRWELGELDMSNTEIDSVLEALSIPLTNGVRMSPAAVLEVCRYFIEIVNYFPGDPRVVFFVEVDRLVKGV